MFKSLVGICLMFVCVGMLAQCAGKHNTTRCSELGAQLGTTGTYINNACYLKGYGVRR